MIRSSLPSLLGGAAVLLVLAGLPSSARSLEQVIDLEPGWNAVFVRLDPQVNDIEAVFADLPVKSVWRYIPDDRGAEFVADPAEGLQNLDGWFGWFPEPRPEAFLSNLFTISGNTAYLIEMEGADTHQITITGDPVFRPPRWRSNAFALTGLPVSPDQPPTFFEFFETSGAHSGQPFYRLRPDGTWELIEQPATTFVDANAAYWIRTNGNSRYQGRMALVLEQDDRLEYGRALDEIQIVLRNQGNLDGSFQIQRLSGTDLPLRFLLEDPETDEQGWPALPDTLVRQVDAGSEVFLTLGIRRDEMTSDRMEQSFAITDEHGGRILLHAGADTIQPLVQAVRGAAGLATRSADAGALAGLWQGVVQVEAVSEAQLAGTQPTPTGKPFEQRFLIHVDAAGQARLLKEAILMWEEGTLAPSDQNPEFQEVETPGRYVLITNKQLIPLYTGATVRNGESVGIRASTIAYDFEDEFMEMDGQFGPGGSVGVTITMEPEFPTNPFRHKYHPDHDNKDAQFVPGVEEAFQVVRDMQFDFAVDDPLELDPPGWGSTIVGGTFQEALTGLHKNRIFVSGSFRMRRISNVPVLNQ
jgi:hypothetical protein